MVQCIVKQFVVYVLSSGLQSLNNIKKQQNDVKGDPNARIIFMIV